MDRSGDWLAQAQRDLEQAEDSLKAGRHEWACFAAQQAAEKAVKALHLHFGQEVWGHVVAEGLQLLPSEVQLPPELVEKAQFLDNLYIGPRYPNTHPSGAPYQHYGRIQSEQAIAFAREIIDFTRIQMA